MNTNKANSQEGQIGETVQSLGKRVKCCSAPKWAAIVNDKLIPMPSKRVAVQTIIDQAGLQMEGFRLFRDHNSPDDTVLSSTEEVNLSKGNVFYTKKGCCEDKKSCKAPAKLAYIVDDRWEVSLLPKQSKDSLLRLFGIKESSTLLRDMESCDDVTLDGDVLFKHGCVFRTEQSCEVLRIIVNKRTFTIGDGVKTIMTLKELAALVEQDVDKYSVAKLVNGKYEPILGTEPVHIANCDEFRVLRCGVVAGASNARVQREINELTMSDTQVTLVGNPISAVIYHDVPVKSGLPVDFTDVLVKIPAGYPAGIIDNAFLPVGSPLLNLTPGACQQIEKYNELSWQQKSIHPYTAGSIRWNASLHGFHTYYTEIQNWLN